MPNARTVPTSCDTADRIAAAEETISALCDVVADLGRQADGTGGLNELRERRISAIEEVIAAPRPRRWLLAARLRRQLRESVHGGVSPGTWHEQRAQAMTREWILGPRGRPGRRKKVSPAPWLPKSGSLD